MLGTQFGRICIIWFSPEITEQEINYCINDFKNSKAASPFDNIINEYIKSTKHLILPLYYKQFNCVLETGFIPTTWLEGAIIPIFKNINVNKAKVVVFGVRSLQNYSFKIGTQSLEVTNKYHYLGLTFTSNGSFLNACKHIAEQANKAMHYLYTRIYNADLPLDLSLKLFDHTVLPIVLYGAEIFGYENTDILERIHSNFLRKITNFRKSTPMSFLYGDLGRYPISINIQSRMVSFWNRILVGKSDKISLKIYKYMIHLQDNNFK